MAAIFQSPSSFAYHVGKDLIVNGKDIFHEVDTAIVDYKAGNWADFGENVGMAAAKTILGKTSQTQIKVGEVTQGMIRPFGGKFNLEALLECIYEEDQAALILDAAYQEFVTAYKNKSISDLIGGIIAVVAGVQQVKQGIPVCKAIDTTSWNYAGFDKSTDIMLHPTKNFKIIEEELFINGISIMEYAGKAAQAYGDGEFEVFGENMGEILKLATHVDTMKDIGVHEKKEYKKKFTTIQKKLWMKKHFPSGHYLSHKDMTALTQGFLEATNVGTFNFTQLLMCIRDADQAALILDGSVTELKKAYMDKNVKEAIGGIIEAVAFVQELKQTIPICKAVDTKDKDWTTFNNIVNTLESPTQHMAQIGEDVILNGHTITKEIAEALDSYRSAEWEQFGRQLGSVLRDASAPIYLY